jgi:CheY-like chemotaxis protein
MFLVWCASAQDGAVFVRFQMTLAGRNVLLVGQNFQSAQTLTGWLHRWKFRCHFVTNVRAANEFLAAHTVDLVLSNTHLSDGTGYQLLMNLARLPFSAFLCLPVENSCIWLPAINDGKRCLGLPALRPSEFARALQEMALRLSS